jgi:type IV pilus assembly protein PilY1
MKKVFIIFILVILSGVLCAEAATNNDYCTMPLFMTNAVKPDIMVVMDLSGSMQFPAYLPCDWDSGGYKGYSAYCESSTTASPWVTAHAYKTGDFVTSGGNFYQCIVAHTSGTFATDLANGRWSLTPTDGHYDGTATSYNTAYYGYFDSTKNYTYNTTGGYWQASTTCTVSSSHATIGTACVPGNILNWSATSRVDVARKIITGGRASVSGSTVSIDSEGGYFSYNDANLHCKISFFETDWNNPTTRQIAISDYSGTCVIGHFGTAPTFDGSGNLTNTPVGYNVNVLFSTTGALPTAILDEFNDKATFETMIYNSSSGNQGIITSYKNDSLDYHKNGRSTSLLGLNKQRPYNGTPTGTALWEAYDFFKQNNGHNGSTPDNSGTIDKENGTNDRDPWWDGTGTGKQAVACRKSFVLLISDGAFNGGADPVVPAYLMHTTDLRPDATESSLPGMQNVTVYTIYAFGDLDPDTRAQGRQSMITTALFGGFTFDLAATNPMPYPFSGSLTAGGSSSQCHSGQSDNSSSLAIGATNYCNSRDVSFPLSQCNPPGSWNGSCSQWDNAATPTGLPYNFFEADDPAALETRIKDAINSMLRRASSGTAASVLASSEGSGANLLQAVFYPSRLFDNTEVQWISEIQNLWFYVDPWFRGANNIREDSIENKILDMTSDNVIEFAFENNKTVLKRYIPNSDGSKGTATTPSPDDIDNAHDIWKAGEMLFERNITTTPRTIFTSLTGIEPHLDFSVANASSLQTYLQASTVTEAENIIKFIQGYDITGYRNRTITRNTITNTWKLGDIISSTPRLKASFPLNSYDLYPPEGYRDGTYTQYINSTGYKERGMVYVGANDGMLHAFELGKLNYTGLSAGQIAQLETTDEPLGTERWAFIPKGALPYLKYLTQTDYCHMFYVDNPVTISDVSINDSGSGVQNPNKVKDQDSWRTILVGAMGIGGACRNMTSTCSTATDCVKTPVNNVGYSAYFALDITDPINPKLLWEFSRDDLGFTTTGPAIMRLGDPARNGKWFVVFGSGPTGPINTTYHQFMGSSNQNLKLFVLDLLQGPAASVQEFDTGIANAFGGSLFSATLDINRNDQSTGTPYQDDVLYMGFTKKDSVAGTWTKGGVVRMLTNNDITPSNWTVSTFIDNIRPVTSAVTKLIDTRPGKKNLWVYFGTGRYYYRLNNGLTIDDPTNQQTLYGVKEPCYTISGTLTNNCATVVNSGDLAAASASIPSRGWFINLDVASTTYKAERVITDPLAIPSGIVFFTTVAPSSDVCSFGGKTALWFPWYETGGLPPPAALARLEAMLQVSTGSIIKIGFGGSFTNPKVGVSTGIPSKDQGLTVFTPPPPVRRILHMKEK